MCELAAPSQYLLRQMRKILKKAGVQKHLRDVQEDVPVSKERSGFQVGIFW